MVFAKKVIHPRAMFFALLFALVFGVASFLVAVFQFRASERVTTISAWETISVVIMLVFAAIFYSRNRDHSAGRLSYASYKRLVITTSIVFFTLALGLLIDTFVVPQGKAVYIEDVPAEVLSKLPPEIAESIPTRAEGETIKSRAFDTWRTVFPSNIPLESNDDSEDQ